MKGSRWAQKYVKCPFWRWDTVQCIACEGPFDGAGLHLTFDDVKGQRRHMEVFCADAYKYCEVYRMVKAAKYEE